MSIAIQTEDLTKKFGSIHALKNFDLQVSEGTILCDRGTEWRRQDHSHQDSHEYFRAHERTRHHPGHLLTRDSGIGIIRYRYVSENQELPGWMRIGEFLDYLRPFYPLWDRALEVRLIRSFELPLGTD